MNDILLPYEKEQLEVQAQACQYCRKMRDTTTAAYRRRQYQWYWRRQQTIYCRRHSRRAGQLQNRQVALDDPRSYQARIVASGLDL